MKENILKTSAELFLTLGFKSVTMDDIAKEMGISKKTIYQHFENKTKLVEATTLSVFQFISSGIDGICALEKNPIEEIYDIKNFVMMHLKGEKSSPQYQLQKYYPKLFLRLKAKQFEVMQNCFKKNLERGIGLGFYRENINVEFITRIYFNCMIVIKDRELFPETMFSIPELMNNYIDYHLRGICNTNGLNFLNELQTNPNKQ